MSSAKKDFFADKVVDAIKQACDALGAPQEELDIDVVETGSNGIFGLIKKKAHIRAAVKGSDQDDISQKPEIKKVPKKTGQAAGTKKSVVDKPERPTPGKKEKTKGTEPAKKKSSPSKTAEPIKEESAELVRHELSEIISLMGFPSEVTAEIDGPTIRCRVNEEHEEALTAQDGKIIDSLQYLLRKVAARKIEEKVRLSIDIGQFREKRKVELMERAKELAALVKEDGKTQAIPPLNPSERRIVHVALQDDKDIRSRSVGGGLFKKILIYKPGKGKKTGGNRRGGKGKSNARKKMQEKKTASEE